MLGALEPSLCSLPLEERLSRVYRAFVDRLPFENLSNHRACSAAPADPDAWPRATDRVLRDHLSCGLGGTSFSLAYALRDLLHGVGGNAHLALGRNLVTEEMHAAVLVFLDSGPVLFDASILASGAVPVHPGGALEDPLGRVRLEPCRGATLTLVIARAGADRPRAAYALAPAPSPPHRFRAAWVASFERGRRRPLRLARRVGDVIRRYTQSSSRLEVLTPGGIETRRLGTAPVDELHELFGIRADCLTEWFALAG